MKTRWPRPAVDVIIELNDGEIVLVRRKNPPYGWAIPGGFVEYGESLETAAVREACEETTLDVRLIRQFHTYSDPARDPRGHTISTVYIAKAHGLPCGADDAAEAWTFRRDNLPENIVFDHRKILDDYWESQMAQMRKQDDTDPHHPPSNG